MTVTIRIQVGARVGLCNDEWELYMVIHNTW